MINERDITSESEINKLFSNRKILKVVHDENEQELHFYLNDDTVISIGQYYGDGLFARKEQ